MNVIADLNDKSNFISPDFTIAEQGLCQFLVFGAIGRGAVILEISLGGEYVAFPDLAFSKAGGAQVELDAGDVCRIRFVRCTSAGALLRQV